MILRDGMKPVLVGIALGLVGALAGTRVLESLILEVSSRNPLSLTATVVILLLAAWAATLLPARRATRVDPVRALASE